MIEQWIERVCAHAGWALPSKDSRERYRFRLENDLTVDAWSPDERTLVLEAMITSLDGFNRADLVKRAATAVLPRVFIDRSVVSLDREGQSLNLHTRVTLGALRAADFSGVMENFLNDLAFYRAL